MALLSTYIAMWYAFDTGRDRHRLQRIALAAEKAARPHPFRNWRSPGPRRRLGQITSDLSRHGLFKPLPSGRRLQSSRHMRSFFPGECSSKVTNCHKDSRQR